MNGMLIYQTALYVLEGYIISMWPPCVSVSISHAIKDYDYNFRLFNRKQMNQLPFCFGHKLCIKLICSHQMEDFILLAPQFEIYMHAYTHTYIKDQILYLSFQG